LAAAGAVLVRLALGSGSPAAIAASAGALILVLPGLWLAVHAGAFQLRRLKAGRKGTSPWSRDRRWDPSRVRDEESGGGLKILGVGLFLAAFLTPLHLALLDAGAGDLPAFLAWVPWVGLALFDVAALGVTGQGLWLLAKGAAYGRTELRLHGFPFRPGGRVEVTFTGEGALRRVEAFRAELNLVEEDFLPSATGRGRTPVWRSLHHEAVAFELDPSGRALLTFDLPEEAPANDLWGEPPRYWELEIVGSAPGGDYRGLFMLPVYRS
jgi:hypothetical protein